MASKLLMQLQADVVNGVVKLEAYKSTPAFQNSANENQLFRVLRIYRKEEPDFIFGCKRMNDSNLCVTNAQTRKIAKRY